MSDDITWLAAWRIRELIGARELSPVEVLQHFLGRIETFDPVLRAFRHRDVDGARRQAEQAEEAVLRGEPLGPLHGIPVSVKEHIAVAGLPVMALGAAGDSARIARYDDLGVARLRAAGAVIVGSNTMMGTSASAPFQFDWEREARNPWDPTRAPGWSSSGGAATAAARLLPIAIGSDGGGSTRLPGAYSGVVAVHPTAGLVPSYNPALRTRRDPTVSIGPMTRDVRDAAITLQAMAGPDGRDFDCIQSRPPDYAADLDAGLGNLHLAWTDDYGFAARYAFPQSAGVIAAVREATASTLARLRVKADETEVDCEDFWPGYVTTNYLFGGGPTGTVERPSREAWIDAHDVRHRNWQRLRDLFDEYDLLLSPTSQIVAPTIEDWASWWAGEGPVAFPHGTFAPHYTSHTHLFNWLGFPAVNVPCGLVQGLPIGLQVVGWPGSEAAIFRFAQAFLSASPFDAHPPVS